MTHWHWSIKWQGKCSNRALAPSRPRAGLAQDAVAERMGATKSVISRLEFAGKHALSLATLNRFASTVGWELQVKLVRHKAP
jgi:transcriptional regulator with XRE-family HTH domain